VTPLEQRWPHRSAAFRIAARQARNIRPQRELVGDRRCLESGHTHRQPAVGNHRVAALREPRRDRGAAPRTQGADGDGDTVEDDRRRAQREGPPLQRGELAYVPLAEPGDVGGVGLRMNQYLLDLTASHRNARDAGEISTDQVALDLVNQARSAERSRPGRGHRSDSSFTAQRGEPAKCLRRPKGQSARHRA
jgi:hypothetical protein